MRICAIAALGLSLLGGCVIVPIPVRDIIDGVRMGAEQASAATDKEAEPGILRVAVRSVCIELNPQLPDEEVLVPLRARLARYRLPSRVFDAGTAPSDCDAVLVYEGGRVWESVWTTGGETRPFLDSVVLALRKGGKVLATGSYRAGGQGPGRKSASAVKVAFALDQLLTSVPQ